MSDGQPGSAGDEAPAEPPDGRAGARPSLFGRVVGALRGQILRGHIERARARRPAVDVTFAAIERDVAIGGAILAGALAYRLFLYVLPLGFFLVSGLGLLADLLGVEPESIGSNIGLASIVTEQVADAAKSPSSWWVALTSFVILLFVTHILFRAVSVAYALASSRSAAAVRVSLHGFLIFFGALSAQLALVAVVGAVRERSAAAGVVALFVQFAAVCGLWVIVSRELPLPSTRVRDVLPGAALYAVGIMVLQVFNAFVLDRILEQKSSTYGTLGTAAALLLSLYIAGRAIVAAAVLNATLFERRHPIGPSRERGS